MCRAEAVGAETVRCAAEVYGRNRPIGPMPKGEPMQGGIVATASGRLEELAGRHAPRIKDRDPRKGTDAFRPMSAPCALPWTWAETHI